MASFIFSLIIKGICNWGDKLDKFSIEWSSKSRKMLDNKVITISFLLITFLLVNLFFNFEIGANSNLVSLKYLTACQIFLILSKKLS